MPDAPTTQAEQEDAVRESIALRDELMVYAAQLLRAETQAGFASQDLSVRVKEPAHLANLLTRAASAVGARKWVAAEAQREQLAADLRKAREALKVAQSALAMLTEPQAIRTTRVHEAWATAVDAELQCRRALTPDHKDAGGPAKGDDHAA